MPGRKRCSRRSPLITLLFLTLLATVAFISAVPVAPGRAPSTGPVASFLGAGEGLPIPYETLTLPAVIIGPHNDPPLVADPTSRTSDHLIPCGDGFIPTFDELVTGETIITNDAAMAHIWNRLFTTPYDPNLFDFQDTFAVLMGGGLMHPWFGFEISSVEQFESTFTSGTPIPEIYAEPALAIVATTILPGVPPPPKDDVYKVAAVSIPRAHLDDIIFNRQVLALP